jgi:hypothetical protein
MSCVLFLIMIMKEEIFVLEIQTEADEWEVEVKPNRMIIWPSNFSISTYS